ncbi:MAG: PIG-L family deacetylase [Chloroflexota bacterium]
MHWIYLSPHLDDVALSLGGLLWEQTSAGDQVSVWTICAADPPPGPFSPFADSLHARWNTGRDAVAARREEDIQSCAHLGAAYRHFSIYDCIYRTSLHTGAYLYPSEHAIFDTLHPDDAPVIEQLALDLSAVLPADARVVCPLSIGGHVDHQLTLAAAEKLGLSLWYYAEYPYVLYSPIVPPQGANAHRFSIPPPGMVAWGNAVAAHRSQISTFWGSIPEMQRAITDYSEQIGGLLLWN